MTINTNPQTWILTTYGIQRITEVMSSPNTERLFVNHIKLGDANETYYTPIQGINNDLKNPIEDAEFSITNKSVDGSTVTFDAFIPESSGGYNIREIGLYERINNQDFCLALGTCEPIVKPAYDEDEDYGYAMAISYKLHINSVNLASIYPQIVLNPQTEYVRKEELEALSKTVLFVEGNLMEQISNNSHLLGLNRAQQLKDLIDSTRTAYAYSSIASLFSNVTSCIDGRLVKGFWGFNYTEKFDSLIAVKDFSSYGNNFSLNKDISDFKTDNFGILPYIYFTPEDYFYAPYVESLKMENKFSIIFAGQFNKNNEANTILAQGNDSSSIYNWTVVKTSTGAVEIKLYSDSNNYLTYTTNNGVVPNSPCVIGITVNLGISENIVKVFVNNKKVSVNKIETGNFTVLASNNMETSSYIYSSSGKSKMINAKVSFLSLIATDLEDAVVRAVNLNLMAVLGKNIFRGD